MAGTASKLCVTDALDHAGGDVGNAGIVDEQIQPPTRQCLRHLRSSSADHRSVRDVLLDHGQR
jgi:hypothetical protein